MIQFGDGLLKIFHCFALIQNTGLVYKLQKAAMYLSRLHYNELSFLKVSFLTRKKKSILLSSSFEGIMGCNTDKVKPMLLSSHC